MDPKKHLGSLGTFCQRQKKTYEHASNAGINFFLAWVKSVPNSKLFCRKNELCRNFALFMVILKNRKTFINHIFIASIDVWQSKFDHTFCKIYFTLFRHELNFVAIYTLFWVKSFWLKPCLCKKNSMSAFWTFGYLLDL